MAFDGIGTEIVSLIIGGFTGYKIGVKHSLKLQQNWRKRSMLGQRRFLGGGTHGKRSMLGQPFRRKPLATSGCKKTGAFWDTFDDLLKNYKE